MRNHYDCFVSSSPAERDPLKPDRNVNPVAVELSVLPNDNVTQVEPNT